MARAIELIKEKKNSQLAKSVYSPKIQTNYNLEYFPSACRGAPVLSLQPDIVGAARPLSSLVT